MLMHAVAAAQSPDGARVFQQHCAACHAAGPDQRAPALEALRQLSTESVMRTLFMGAMRIPGARLTVSERRAVAEYVTGKPLTERAAQSDRGRCTQSAPFQLTAAPQWNGWGAGVANTRFQATGAGLTAAQIPRLTLKWAFGFPDANTAWGQPSVVGGRVFVGSQYGLVYSLDAKTGCTYWAFQAQGGVRTATVVGARPNGGAAVYFGDTTGMLYAVDASTGKQIWSRRVDEHPLVRITSTPTLYQGRLYVGTSSPVEEMQGGDPDYRCCTFRGSVSSIDAATGRVVWKSYTIKEASETGTAPSGRAVYGPSGGGVWGSPTIDAKRRLVYVGTGNLYTGPPDPGANAILAFELNTGRLRWSNQTIKDDVYVYGCKAGELPCVANQGPDHDFGQSPMLVTAGGKDILIAAQKSGVAWALDPDKRGAVLWQYRAGRGGMQGGMEWGSAADDRQAYFPVSDSDKPQPGGLHAVRIETGEPVWVSPPAKDNCKSTPGCSAAQLAAITVFPGVVLSGTNDGMFRAYSTADGSVLWEYDTNRDFDTVNGVKGHGGSISGPGAVVVGGMLFLNSGYSVFSGFPGNVLLAFGVD
jgi:polyvinyl alcohol dehydrogenase (cytochrome)